jgi:hypothetical protein
MTDAIVLELLCGRALQMHVIRPPVTESPFDRSHVASTTAMISAKSMAWR